MMVEIILNDDEGQPVLKLTNCHQPELIGISTYLDDYKTGVEVSIEELKLALRKICTK